MLRQLLLRTGRCTGESAKHSHKSDPRRIDAGYVGVYDWYGGRGDQRAALAPDGAGPQPTGGDIIDQAAAVRLGKALFWDMQTGGDGMIACATCHFHAGADNRLKNPLNPGPVSYTHLTLPTIYSV